MRYIKEYKELNSNEPNYLHTSVYFNKVEKSIKYIFADVLDNNSSIGYQESDNEFPDLENTDEDGDEQSEHWQHFKNNFINTTITIEFENKEINNLEDFDNYIESLSDIKVAIDRARQEFKELKIDINHNSPYLASSKGYSNNMSNDKYTYIWISLEVDSNNKSESFSFFSKRKLNKFYITYKVTNFKSLSNGTILETWDSPTREYIIESENEEMAKNEFTNEWHDYVQSFRPTPTLKVLTVSKVHKNAAIKDNILQFY